MSIVKASDETIGKADVPELWMIEQVKTISHVRRYTSLREAEVSYKS